MDHQREALAAMIAASVNAETLDDLPEVGTFATQFTEGIKSEITPENVEAFILGSQAMSILVQEAILRVTKGATLALDEATDGMAIYATGCQDAATMLAHLLAREADNLISGVIEGPAFEREFNGIVNNL